MRLSGFICGIILFTFVALAYSEEVTYSVEEVSAIIPLQTNKGWWHKQFSSQSGNKYLSSFQSKEHEGKLNWDKKDLREGKIQIIKAMKKARQWTHDNTPFGEKDWEIESVTYRFRPGNDEIEYTCAVTLKTPEYKTLEVIVLPNYELITPVINPKL